MKFCQNSSRLGEGGMKERGGGEEKEKKKDTQTCITSLNTLVETGLV